MTRRRKETQLAAPGRKKAQLAALRRKTARLAARERAIFGPLGFYKFYQVQVEYAGGADKSQYFNIN